MSMGVAQQMYPHLFTAWRRVAAGRQVSWQLIGTAPCRWEEAVDIRPGISGDTSGSTVGIMTPHPLPSGELVAPKDKVAFGRSTEAAPPDTAYAVVSVIPEYRDSRRIDHWEVTAR